MSSCKLTPTRAQQGATYVPKDLFESSFVFIRDDTVRKPLQQPYKGPFKVLKRHVFLVGNNAKFQFRFGCLYCILHHLYIVMFLHVFDISHVL